MTDWNPKSIRALAGHYGLVSDETAILPLDSADVGRVLESLSRWAEGRARLTVVLPDATRELPAGLVERCLSSLAARSVRVVVATGLHRRPSDEEWAQAPHLVELATSGVPVTEDGGQGAARRIGALTPGPVTIAEPVVDSDGVVVLGTVELHQYAGFSGGIKSVAVGCAAPETIGWIHRPVLLKSPGVRVGNTRGNPFRDQLAAFADLLPPVFEVQATQTGGAWRLFGGPCPEGWKAAVGATDAFYAVEPAEAAVVGVLGAKGKNLYQASRGVTQLALQAHPPLCEGAPIVLITEAPDGLGQGPGERAFAKALELGRDGLLRELEASDDSTRASGGAQRAFILALTSALHPVGYVALRESAELTAFGWRYLGDREQASAFLGKEARLSVPDPLHRLPTLAGCSACG